MHTGWPHCSYTMSVLVWCGVLWYCIVLVHYRTYMDCRRSALLRANFPHVPQGSCWLATSGDASTEISFQLYHHHSLIGVTSAQRANRTNYLVHIVHVKNWLQTPQPGSCPVLCSWIDTSRDTRARAGTLTFNAAPRRPRLVLVPHNTLTTYLCLVSRPCSQPMSLACMRHAQT